MISSVLSYLGPPLLLVVAGVMVYRKLYREFPFFFTYLLVVITTEVIRFIVLKASSGLSYFYTYWITEAVEVMLGFLVLYEVFLIRLFPGFNITVIYRRLFPVMGIVVLAMTTWMFFRAPSKGPSQAVAIIGASTLALNFCQVAFLTFFSLLMIYMAREWRRHEVGIAGGFGIHGAVKLLVTAQRAKYFYFSTKIDQLPNISYLIAILIWLFYLSKSDPEPEETPITEEMVDKVEKVYGEVLQMFRRKPRP